MPEMPERSSRAHRATSIGVASSGDHGDRPPHPGREVDIDALLVATGRGDQQAFAELFDRVSPRVLGLVMRIVPDRARAEEVAQDALVDVWKRSPTFDPARGKALGWIFTIAHRRAVDRVRSDTAQSARDHAYESRADVPAEDPTADAVGERMRSQEVHGAIHGLSTSQRQIIELVYFGGRTHREAARELSIPLGTAKTRIREGLRVLRRVMDSDDDPREGKDGTQGGVNDRD